MNIKLLLNYIGTNYSGWQIQQNSNTVQGELEKALFSLTGEKISVIGSGRTDAGVHALGQTANFITQKTWEPQKFIYGLNYYLPRDIRIQSAQKVQDNFNSRFDAKKKTYLYKMYLSDVEFSLMSNRALRIDRGIDVDNMKEAATYLLGKKDFASFMSGGSDVKNTVREIFECDFILNGSELDFLITANGFLYNMVRLIVFCLVNVGKGKINPQDIIKLLEQKNRSLIKGLAPPYGLYLYNVEY